MAKQTANNIKLGFLVITGLLILVFSLYTIGKKKSFFGANFELKARFKDVNGLMKGNNVRFSGIQAGTVNDIDILNDTTIEVVLLINNRVKNYIHKNSLVSIGSEGLMGNKIINIEPNSIPAPLVDEGDMLITSGERSLNDMLQTLDKTNNNIADFSEDIKETIRRINNSKALWNVLNDTSLSGDIRYSLNNFRTASYKVSSMAGVLNEIIDDVNNGRGTAGLLLRDTQTAESLKHAVANANNLTRRMDETMQKLNGIVDEVHDDVKSGQGVVNVVLKDSAISNSLRSSINNIEKGTASFSEDMEALKHNFLLRGYFKKQAKKSRK